MPNKSKYKDSDTHSQSTGQRSGTIWKGKEMKELKGMANTIGRPTVLANLDSWEFSEAEPSMIEHSQDWWIQGALSQRQRGGEMREEL